MTDPLAWTERQAAKALGIGERTLRAWRSRESSHTRRSEASFCIARRHYGNGCGSLT